MSVQENQYIIIGCEYSYKEFKEIYSTDDYNNYEKYVELYCDNGYKAEIVPYKGLSMIYDGMCGKYVFIGKILEKRMSYEYIDHYCFKKIDKKEKKLIKSLIRKYFKKLPNKSVETYLVTHYH